MIRFLKGMAREILLRRRLNRTNKLDSYQKLKQTLKKDKELVKLDTYTINQFAKTAFLQHYSLPVAFTEVANFLLNTGQPEIAQKYYRESLRLEPTPLTHSLYLQCLLLSPSCTDYQMYSEALKYSDFFPKTAPKIGSVPRNLDPHKKLTIGYISHFFHNSVSQSLLTPILKAHNRSQVKIICYSDAPAKDVPDELRNSVDVWHDTHHLDHDLFAQLVQKDEVDVLLETNGHCASNRYLALANKPAPVQISYYNLAATSGVSPIDYIITGSETTADQTYYTETIYYLNGVSGIAQFPEDFPACAPPPFIKNNHITFGSFGATHKVNEQVIKLWARVLKAIPSAKFYMKASTLTHSPYLNAYKKLFAAEGIDLNRIHFEGHSEHRAMLKCYEHMDIALDTFPHAAGTTTMEALWQGVPVITLSGGRQCMQNGKIILTSIGHSELVTYSEDEFVNKAIELAADKNKVLHYRNTLREDFRHSPRADVHSYVNQLENAYRDMWHRYCKAAVQP